MMETFGKITDFWPRGVMEYVETLASCYVQPVEEACDEKVVFTESAAGPTLDPAEFMRRLKEHDAESFDWSMLSNVSKTFVRRHNEGRLTGYFSYDAYVKDEDIRQLLRLFGVDRDKFWLLLLFAYDYSESLCINGVNVAPSAYEQIRSLTETVGRLVTDFDEERGTTLDRETTMKLSVKGAKGVTIDSPTIHSPLSIIHYQLSLVSHSHMGITRMVYPSSSMVPLSWSVIKKRLSHFVALAPAIQPLTSRLLVVSFEMS